MSDNLYFREFSAQVSQIVFLADLTVLRLLTTVRAKMLENSPWRHWKLLGMKLLIKYFKESGVAPETMLPTNVEAHFLKLKNRSFLAF